MKNLSRGLILLICAAVTVGLAWWVLMSTKTGANNDGLAMVKVVVPQLSETGQAGKQLFDENCASCHGGNAVGQDGVAPPLVHIIYEPNHHGDQAFQRAAKQGVRQHHWPFGNMPPIRSVGTEDVTKITAYVRELQRANGIR